MKALACLLFACILMGGNFLSFGGNSSDESSQDDTDQSQEEDVLTQDGSDGSSSESESSEELAHPKGFKNFYNFISDKTEEEVFFVAQAMGKCFGGLHGQGKGHGHLRPDTIFFRDTEDGMIDIWFQPSSTQTSIEEVIASDRYALRYCFIPAFIITKLTGIDEQCTQCIVSIHKWWGDLMGEQFCQYGLIYTVWLRRWLIEKLRDYLVNFDFLMGQPYVKFFGLDGTHLSQCRNFSFFGYNFHAYLLNSYINTFTWQKPRYDP